MDLPKERPTASEIQGGSFSGYNEERVVGVTGLPFCLKATMFFLITNHNAAV